jgi:hypothetical protein
MSIFSRAPGLAVLMAAGVSGDVLPGVAAPLLVGLASLLVVAAALVLIGGLVLLLLRKRRSIAVSPRGAHEALSTLVAQQPLAALDLEHTNRIADCLRQQATGSLEAWKTTLVLGNADAQPALAAAGELRDHRPFQGHLVARFDQHLLAITLSPTEEYRIDLDGQTLGYAVLPLLSREAPRELLDAAHAPVLWHDRPAVHLVETRVGPFAAAGGLRYRVFADVQRREAVAEIRRGAGRHVPAGPHRVTSLDFLRPLPLREKALILAFLLIDLSFNA